MDAMLMGGIVPNAITAQEVDKYLATNTRRKKKIQYNGEKYSANNWRDILLGILTPESYKQLLDLLTQYLQTAANYSITGGPRATEAMVVIRDMIGSAPQPLPQLIVRIIRDMRTLRPSIKKVRRQMFIREPNPVKALRYMQFIPSLGVYKDTIRAAPSSYSKRLIKYRDDPDLRMRAAARALIKARKITGDPNYVPNLMGKTPMTAESYEAIHRLDPRIRQSMRWTKGANSNTDPAILARLQRGRRAAQANLDRAIAQAVTMPEIYGTFNPPSPAQIEAAAAAAAALAPEIIPSSPLVSVPSSPVASVPSSPVVSAPSSTLASFAFQPPVPSLIIDQ